MGEDTGNGNIFAGLPVWVRSALIVGPTTLIALYLVYRIDTRVGAQLDRMETRLEAHAAVTSAASANLSGFVIDSQEESRSMILLLRQLCINTAQDAAQRRECLQR
jgi:hypothetical protein